MQTFNHLRQIFLITYHNQPAVVVSVLLSITCLNQANHSIKKHTHTPEGKHDTRLVLSTVQHPGQAVAEWLAASHLD